MRKCLVLIALLGALPAFAQPPAQGEEKPDPRKNQKIEHLHVEDKGNSIDELRVGGQSQSVKVTPRSGAPAYEMQPTDMARSRPTTGGDSFADRKQRVWNVFGF